MELFEIQNDRIGKVLRDYFQVVGSITPELHKDIQPVFPVSTGEPSYEQVVIDGQNAAVTVQNLGYAAVYCQRQLMSGAVGDKVLFQSLPLTGYAYKLIADISGAIGIGELDYIIALWSWPGNTWSDYIWNPYNAGAAAVTVNGVHIESPWLIPPRASILTGSGSIKIQSGAVATTAWMMASRLLQRPL